MTQNAWEVYQCGQCLNIVGHGILSARNEILLSNWETARISIQEDTSDALCVQCSHKVGTQLHPNGEIRLHTGQFQSYRVGDTTVAAGMGESHASAKQSTIEANEALQARVIVEKEMDKLRQQLEEREEARKEKDEKEKAERDAAVKQEMHKLKYALLAMNERMKKLMEALLEDEEEKEESPRVAKRRKIIRA